MKATRQLRNEHEGIKLILKVLEEFCIKLETGQEINIPHFEQILEFLKIFSDKCHHGKEEEILFPALEKIGLSKERGPVAVMLQEHNEGRAYIRALEKAFTNYKTGNTRAISKIIENARGYIFLLERHIEKENNILFVIAEEHLSEKRQEELFEEFELLETNKIGPGKHDELHGLLLEFKEIYLSPVKERK